MKNKLIIMLCLAAMSAQAQVKFKLQLLADQKTYQVSMLPEKTWASPLNLTSTAQITLVVPTGSFEPKNVQNLQSGVEFHFNSRSDAPAENPGADYVSVGLLTLGTAKLTYQKDLETALFTFENAMPCSGEIRLLDHATDPFFKNQKRKANIGNYLSVFGADGDAYAGNVGTGAAACSSVLGAGDLSGVSEFLVSPNPFVSEINFSADWKNAAPEVKIEVSDALGKVVFSQNFEAVSGKNALRLPLGELVPGVYTFSVRTGERMVFSRKLVKVAL